MVAHPMYSNGASRHVDFSDTLGQPTNTPQVGSLAHTLSQSARRQAASACMTWSIDTCSTSSECHSIPCEPGDDQLPGDVFAFEWEDPWDALHPHLSIVIPNRETCTARSFQSKDCPPETTFRFPKLQDLPPAPKKLSPPMSTHWSLPAPHLPRLSSDTLPKRSHSTQIAAERQPAHVPATNQRIGTLSSGGLSWTLEAQRRQDPGTGTTRPLPPGGLTCAFKSQHRLQTATSLPLRRPTLPMETQPLERSASSLPPGGLTLALQAERQQRQG